jgi:hypothetical protein
MSTNMNKGQPPSVGGGLGLDQTMPGGVAGGNNMSLNLGGIGGGSGASGELLLH